MRQFNDDTEFDETFQSMKKKVTLTDKEHFTVFHQLNKKMEQESQKARNRNGSKKTYYFSLALACILLSVLVLPPTLPIFNQGSESNGSPVDHGAEPTENDQTTAPFDKGHIQLDKVNNQLLSHSETLEDRGDYIGYTYSVEQLFRYLLAINYSDESFIDESYIYQYDYSSFESLVSAYQNHVDFSRIELNHMSHEGYEIEVILNYVNKETGNVEFLHFHLDYSVHQLTDQTSFVPLPSKTALVENLVIHNDTVDLHMTYVEKIDDDSAPNGFRIVESDSGQLTIQVSKEVPVYVFADEVSLLTKVNWEEATEYLPAFIQLYENEVGEVLYIKEIYIP